jgi:pimeloyl-ACP methyl ester carboxylesterase
MRPIRVLALAALAVCASIVPLQAGRTTPAGWTEGYVLANGIRIHYWRTGGASKPALVMAHGSSDDGLCWANLAKELTDRYDVILFDARGHGLSDPPKADDGPDAQVEDLAGLIKALKLEKPVLMGHSMGSASVAWFSAKYPDVPRAVILEDPNFGRPATAAAPATPATPPPSLDERRANVLARNNLTEAALVADCMKNSPKWGQSECEFWAPSKLRHHPDTARVNNALRPPMRDLLPKITAPTLVLKADAQGELRALNEEVAKLLPKGKIVHIAGAGHNVRREGKAETIQVLNAFLNGTARGSN